MANTKSSAAQKSALSVRRKARTGQFVSVKEAEKRPDTTQRERIPLPGVEVTRRFDYKREISRDARTGSFTTSRSTTAIRADVDRFAVALKRLAKK